MNQSAKRPVVDLSLAGLAQAATFSSPSLQLGFQCSHLRYQVGGFQLLVLLAWFQL